ncbi:hypothetical protein Dimus_022229, partial [Dionaea muscipula]
DQGLLSVKDHTFRLRREQASTLCGLEVGEPESIVVGGLRALGSSLWRTNVAVGDSNFSNCFYFI